MKHNLTQNRETKPRLSIKKRITTARTRDEIQEISLILGHFLRPTADRRRLA